MCLWEFLRVTIGTCVFCADCIMITNNSNNNYVFLNVFMFRIMSMTLRNINPQKEIFHHYDFPVYTTSKYRDPKLDTANHPWMLWCRVTLHQVAGTAFVQSQRADLFTFYMVHYDDSWVSLSPLIAMWLTKLWFFWFWMEFEMEIMFLTHHKTFNFDTKENQNVHWNDLSLRGNCVTVCWLCCHKT